MDILELKVDPGDARLRDQSIRAQLPSEPQDPPREQYIVNHALTHASLLIPLCSRQMCRTIEAEQVDASSDGTSPKVSV